MHRGARVGHGVLFPNKDQYHMSLLIANANVTSVMEDLLRESEVSDVEFAQQSRVQVVWSHSKWALKHVLI